MLRTPQSACRITCLLVIAGVLMAVCGKETNWEDVGIAAAERGEWQRAIDAFRRETRLNPDEYDAWFNLGFALSNKANPRRSDNYVAARDAFAAAMVRAPGGDDMLQARELFWDSFDEALLALAYNSNKSQGGEHGDDIDSDPAFIGQATVIATDPVAVQIDDFLDPEEVAALERHYQQEVHRERMTQKPSWCFFNHSTQHGTAIRWLSQLHSEGKVQYDSKDDVDDAMSNQNIICLKAGSEGFDTAMRGSISPSTTLQIACVGHPDDDERSGRHCPALISRLNDRIERKVGLPRALGAASQILSYDVGANYRNHTDCRRDGHRHNERMYSLLLYLTDVEAGGATALPLAQPRPIAVQPRRGRLVLWRNLDNDGNCLQRSLHQSEAVKRGHKLVFQRWFHVEPYHDPAPWTGRTVMCDAPRNCREYISPRGHWGDDHGHGAEHDTFSADEEDTAEDGIDTVHVDEDGDADDGRDAADPGSVEKELAEHDTCTREGGEDDDDEEV